MPNDALEELLAIGGIERAPGQVEISGEDPVLPISFRVGTAASAALAAVGLAASRLWELKSGRRQQVRIDTRAAAVSLRSNTYLRVNGEPPPGPWDPLSGFYPVRDDGWISIHCNFPNHRDAAMGVLGTATEREAAMAASAQWDGRSLEEAIHAAGGCAGLVRTAEQWRGHPQALAVGRQPLLEITKTADSPAEALPAGQRPLAGIRVLDLTRVLAGPTGTRALAEHGADVLKVTAEHLPDSGTTEIDTGLGKLQARLDLRTPEGVDALRELARTGDVFVQSYRPGSLAGRGFSPEALAQLRPGMVCVTLNAWGRSGPWRDRRGFDSIVQAVSGMADFAGDGGKPRLLPVSAIDYISGYLMAYGTMVALTRRATEGGSWHVRVGLARTGKWIVDRGLVSDDALADLPPDLPAAELAPLLAETDSPFGRVTHLKPVVQLSETPAGWARPPTPLGYHAPEWPQR